MLILASLHVLANLLLIQPMSGSHQSIASTTARLGKNQGRIQILALAMQIALDGTGLLAFNQMERPILEPNAHNVFGIVIVLVLSFIKELALERPTVAVVGGGDGLEPNLHLALHLDAVIAVDAGGIGAGELALEIVGVVGLGDDGGGTHQGEGEGVECKELHFYVLCLLRAFLRRESIY